ncbi:MAG: DJ-1/PfpI family protein [Candidatus Marinimicrobia bacterium]|nr:DJ-1/PfpI family protein [Candidatus Neomarinimicrobiota bacterium]
MFINKLKFKAVLALILGGVLSFTPALLASDTIFLTRAEQQRIQQNEIILRQAIPAESGGATVEAIGLFSAPRAAVIQVVTAFEQYPEFMPNVSRIEIVKQDSSGSVLNLTLALPLGVVKKYRIRLFASELSTRSTRIAWHSVEWPGLDPSETIRETSGHWVIQDIGGDSSLVLYQTFTDPGSIPFGLGWIVNMMSKSSVPELLIKTRLRAESIVLQDRASPDRTSDSSVLFVVTSHSQLGSTGGETGYYFSEVTHPYFQLVDAGFSVDIASPMGGEAPMDKTSLKLHDQQNKRFFENPDHMQKLIHTLPLIAIEADDYAVIFFVGGHGSMWDFPENQAIGDLTAQIYENGGVAAAVYHGPSALVDIKLSDGTYLVAGKTLTAFTNEEEVVKQLTDEMPFLLESKLVERGAVFTNAAVWQENIVISDRLITGQNPASAAAVGKAIVQFLKSSKHLE